MYNKIKFLRIKKIFLSLFFLLFIFNFPSVKAGECNSDYMKKLVECKKAIMTGSYKSLDFICVQSESDVQLFQIILDDLFKKVDVDAKNSLIFMQTNKDYYFKTPAEGEEAPNFLNGVDNIDSDFGILGKYYFRYKTICDKTLIEEFGSCNDASSPVTIKGWDNQDCMSLAKIKLNIYKRVAYNHLLLNKLELRRDNRTVFMQDIRKSYSYLLKLFDINISYLERIAFKWKVKIKNGYLP